MLIGRKKERTQLNKILNSGKSEFLAVYGRRRIGKTFLIRQFFEKVGLYFELAGVKNANTKDQLKRFANQFSKSFYSGKPIKTPISWLDAFETLASNIEKTQYDGRIILFFDELPWLASKRSKFLSALDYLWNHDLSRDNRIILVVCGSAAAWMIKKIIHDKGGLHGRLTRQMRLMPFTLSETKEFLYSKNIDIEHQQILEIYMSLGGVPKYLDYIESVESSAQLINQLFFDVAAPLQQEFYEIYSSLFDDYEKHITIVKILANKHYGLTKNELLKLANLHSGGSSTNILRELEASGFIMYIPSYGKKKSSGCYKLIDEFSLFFLKFVDQVVTEKMSTQNYWITRRNSPAWYAWAGYAFENVCWRHLNALVAEMGLGAVHVVVSQWRHLAANKADRGAQLDMIIDRADRVINLCEMKYSDGVYCMTKEVAASINTKRQVFRHKVGAKKALLNILITAQDAGKNSHFHAAIDQHITIQSLFNN